MSALRRACFLSLVACLLGLSFPQRAIQVAADGPLVFLPLLMVSHIPRWIGPDGGLVAAVAIYPPDPSIVYAGSWGGGVYRSRDGGSTWIWKSQGLDNLTVVSLAVDPSDPQVVYAGTYRGKIFKTIDGGETWALSSQGVQDQAIVYSIVVDPGQPQRVYAATRGLSNNGGPPWAGVVYRSEDGGASWQRKLYNLAGSSVQDWAYSLTIHPLHPSILFAATHEHGIYRSSNYGDSWSSRSSGITNLSTRAVVAGTTAEYENYLYTGVWERIGVFRSTNQGVSWTQKSSGLPEAHIYGMDIDPFRPRTIYLATYNIGVMKTTNAASSWFRAGLGSESIATLRIQPLNSDVVFAGTAGGGLYASPDGGASWAPSQAGLSASSTTGLVVSPLDPATYYAGVDGGGVQVSSNEGTTWSDFSAQLGARLVNGLVEQPGRDRLFALTDGAGLYRCDLLNPASCWQRVGTNLPVAAISTLPSLPERPFSSRGTFFDAYDLSSSSTGIPSAPEAPEAVAGNSGLLALAFAPSDPERGYLGTSGSGLYKTANGGDTWQTAGLSGLTVWAVAVDPLDGLRVYAATSQAGAAKTSSDGGGHWTNLSLSGVTFYSLAVSPTGTVIAGTNNGVYRLDGSAWTWLGLPGSTVAWLTVHPMDPDRFLAGTTDGAYFSEDGGVTWQSGPAELAGHTVQSISIDPFHPGVAYFCTTAHGVLRTNVP